MNQFIISTLSETMMYVCINNKLGALTWIVSLQKKELYSSACLFDWLGMNVKQEMSYCSGFTPWTLHCEQILLRVGNWKWSDRILREKLEERAEYGLKPGVDK